MFARLAQFSSVTLALVMGNYANAAPLTYRTYYDETVTNLCNGNACRVNFSQLPSDKLTMVSQVSCTMASTGAPVLQVLLEISAGIGGGAVSTRNYALSFPAPALTGSVYSTNVQQNIHYLIGQGRFPYVFVSTSNASFINMSCTIVGDLVTPIQ